MSSERQQPGQKGQQADVRGQLRSWKPPGPGSDGQLQVASRDRSRLPGRKLDAGGNGADERLRTGTDEDARAGAAWLGLCQLEVVTQVHQPGQPAARDEFVQVRKSDRPTLCGALSRPAAQPDRGAADEHPLAPQPHRTEDRCIRSRTSGFRRRPFAGNAACGIRLGRCRAEHLVVGRHPEGAGGRCQLGRRFSARFRRRLACECRLTGGDAAQATQFRLNLRDERCARRGRRLTRFGGVMLDTQEDEPRSDRQHHRQHHESGQPSGIPFANRCGHRAVPEPPT